MMKDMYALLGEKSGEYLSYDGKVLVHWDAGELQFLVPGPKVVKLQKVPDSFMHIGDHPQLKGVVEFPIDKSDFRSTE